MKTDFSHCTQIRVRYGETDQMGYCYYGNYAQYFEVGRVEALRSIGMSYREMEESGYMLPVSHFSVDYIKPAFYDEELTIKTTISELKGARLFFDYEIRNLKDEILAKAQTILVFVLKETMKPTPPPTVFTSLIQKYAR